MVSELVQPDVNGSKAAKQLPSKTPWCEFPGAALELHASQPSAPSFQKSGFLGSTSAQA